MTEPATFRRPFYLVVEGVIGVGKTSLTQRLAQLFEAEALYEPVTENPFLARFYQDPERYAFPTQIFFLVTRYRQLARQVRPLLQEGRSVVADYGFLKDPIFARLNLQGDEWDVYWQLYETLDERLPQPDLIVYLRAPLDQILRHIARRGREFERHIPREYLARLAQAYDEVLDPRKRDDVLVLDTTGLDFVHRSRDLQTLVAAIRQALARRLLFPA